MKTAIQISLLMSIVLSPAMAADESSTLLTAFKSHCVKCHGKGDKNEADVDLSTTTSYADLAAQPELIENLIAVLADRQMPPEDEPTLPNETRHKMVVQLQSILIDVLETQPFNPTPIRRMNRFQYNNAVVDLLELDRDLFQMNERLLRRREDYFRPETRKMPDRVRVSSRPLSKDIDNQRPEGFRGVAAFPQDKRAEHGFDNRADHLTLSPLLMESFLKLSETIATSPDLNPQECRSWNWLFAAPGQTGSSAAGRIEGEAETQMRFVKKPKDHAARQDMAGFGPGWSGAAQLFWMCPKPERELAVSFNVSAAGNGLRFGLTRAPDYGTFEIHLDGKQIGEAVDLYDPKVSTWEHAVTDLDLKPGRHTLMFRCVGKNQISPKYFFGLDFVDVLGIKPSEPKKTEVTLQDEIQTRLKKLLRRAFRRPADAATLNRFTQFAEQQITAGASFEETMRTIVGAVIGMPEFLYLYEGGADVASDSQGRASETSVAGRDPVNDFELASRLSQFFWSSIPDDELLHLAEAGKLSEAELLSAQIDRMMNDERSARFCDNFPGQWLQLERLVTSIPDRQKYPYFYYHGYRTSMHMMSEPLLLFETVFVEDRSVVELLDPKFTWQSSMLQSNYQGKANGGHDVQVQVFNRVKLEDPRRGGIITNAAIMTMTSTPTRTQPITRGAWVNAVIFNDPPEPPPADVPPLPEADAEELAKLTIRERLAVHRKRSDCAGCHNKIDPLGFALENYGPTGVWRDKYENGRDVDVAGTLFNQHEFKTLLDFKAIILQQKHRFIRGFAAHLLSYALGRELGPADSPALDDITEKAMNGDDSLRTIMKNVAMSQPFLHKNVQANSHETE